MKNGDPIDAQTSVRLSTKMLDRLHPAAIDENRSMSDTLRGGFERCLGHAEHQDENARHNASVFAYIHVLLEFPIHKDHPGIRPQLIAVGRKKSEAHHGLWQAFQSHRVRWLVGSLGRLRSEWKSPDFHGRHRRHPGVADPRRGQQEGGCLQPL